MKLQKTKPVSRRSWLPAWAMLLIVSIILVAVASSPRVQSSQGAVSERASALGAIPAPVSTQGVATPFPQATQAQPTLNPMGNCPPNWYESNDQAVLDTCAKLKETISKEQRAQEIATMQAQPSVQTIPNFTPVPLLPPPDYANVVRELPWDPYKGARPVQWRDATSVWQVGAVPNSDYTSWVPLYVVSRPGSNGQPAQSQQAADSSATATTSNANPTLEIMLLEGLGGSVDAKYNKRWVFPQAAGEIYITSVTRPTLNIPDKGTPFPGLQGVISFKTKGGQTGKFDLAREAWILDTPAKAP